MRRMLPHMTASSNPDALHGEGMDEIDSPDRRPLEAVSACTSCNGVNPGTEEWLPLAEFLRRRFGLSVQACVCPECLSRFYPELVKPPEAAHRDPGHAS